MAKELSLASGRGPVMTYLSWDECKRCVLEMLHPSDPGHERPGTMETCRDEASPHFPPGHGRPGRAGRARGQDGDGAIPDGCGESHPCTVGRADTSPIADTRGRVHADAGPLGKPDVIRKPRSFRNKPGA